MFAFAAGVQIYILEHSEVKIHVWQKYTAGDPANIPQPTCPSFIVTQGRRVSEDIRRLQHTYLRHCDNSPDVITCCHAGKYSALTVHVMLLFNRVHIQTNTNAKCIINVIVSLIQHDIHDWNLSQPQWAACCCIHKKFVSPRMLWIY